MTRIWWCGWALALLLPLQIGAQGTVDSSDLIERAREVRFGAPSGVGAYQARVMERWSTYVRLPLVDRLAFRREVEAHVAWLRDGPDTVRVVGARRFRPSLGHEVAVLEDIESEARDITFNPDRDLATIGIGTFRLGRHPLRTDVMSAYRFDLGDTLAVELPSGRRIQLTEVTVTAVTDLAEVSGTNG